MKRFFYVVLLLITIACEDLIEVPDISDATVVLLAPSHQSTLSITSPTFSWNEVVDADSYRLQIATPSFEAATQIVLDTTITATNFTKMLSLGNYQWRVRAENSAYQTNYTANAFVIE
ncbi:hypothetical protein [Pontimicrobium sp. IMCC45349]|uniref:hypothetical protein n=1 Tax=Pontimicrobium sp. IMCC45349 TaxID=3391574 RepID=UPI0039A3E39E